MDIHIEMYLHMLLLAIYLITRIISLNISHSFGLFIILIALNAGQMIAFILISILLLMLLHLLLLENYLIE